MATYYRTGVETYSIIGTADERGSLEGRIPDGSTYFAVDENMFYTFYDGQWYETLPEAARLYHDDVGTDTKPIKLVGGVATVVANELAEDSKVVHTTGNETVDGEKTLLTVPIVSAAESGIVFQSSRNESSNQRITTLKFTDATNPRNNPLSQFAVGRSAQYNFVVSYLKRGTTEYPVTFRAYTDHMDIAVTPYYPVDGSSNPQALTDNALMASGNIAVDPRLVHVFGNETIAGAKTFSGVLATTKDFGWCRTYTHTVAPGAWAKVYEVKRVASSGGLADIFNDFALDTWRGIEMYWGIGAGSGGYRMSGAIYGNVTTMVGRLVAVMARRASDKIAEIWIGNAQASGNINLVIDCKHVRSEPPIPSEATGEKPVVGNTYSEVLDMSIY